MGGMLGGGGGGTSASTEVSLPKYANPTAKHMYRLARELTRNPYNPNTISIDYAYDLPVVAEYWTDIMLPTGYTVPELAGMDASAYRAKYGNSILDRAKEVNYETITGKFFDNPDNRAISDSQSTIIGNLDTEFEAALQLIYKKYYNHTVPNITYWANRTNSVNSSGHCIKQAEAVEAVQKEIYDLAAKLYMGHYDSERRAQVAAYADTLRLAQEDIKDGETLRSVGTMKREYAQNFLTDTYKRWVAEKDGEIRKTEIWATAIKTLRGAGSSVTTPYFLPSPASQLFGFAATGAGLGLGLYNDYKMLKEYAPSESN